MSVTLGSSRVLNSGRLKGRRVGIVSNPASVDAGFTHIVDALMQSPDVTLGAIFGPQHGFRSDVQDNMIETPHGNDCRRKVPVFSLYSETREPTAEMLRHVDVMLIDLQDIGARIYTYIYTMANCLRAGAKHGIDVIVCDRPNPIGGRDVEGPMLVPGNESFVGQFPIPMRHGMTIGELARLFNDYFEIKAPLEVVDMEGWSRSMYFDQTGLPFVMPSPNIPDARQRHRLSGHGVVRGHDGVGSARHDAPVRTGRRAVGRGGAFRRSHERAPACPGCIFARRCSSRPSRNTRSGPAAGVRSTCSIATPSSRS